MYFEHFNLNLQPFQINTDPRFLYLSEQHREALAILRYGILFDRGSVVLTGDVGTGKSILVRTLIETLGPEVRTAVISDPGLRGLDFLNFVAHAFGMETNFKNKSEFLISFSDFLDRRFAANQKALLVLDEAQYIDPIQLEEIRILSNFERENNQRLIIFFVGQNEFNSMIADNRLRALKQRITCHFHLGPLSLKETIDYVRYRLKVAGCHRPLFTPSALKKIFRLTKGYPRLINILCDLCLMSAFAKDLDEIVPAIVKESAADLMHPSQMNEKYHSSSEKRPRFDSALNADSQRFAAPKTPPVVTTQTTEQAAPPERLKPFALFLQTFLRKPAYLFAVVILLSAFVWFNFNDDHSRQESSLSQKIHQENQTKADVELIQSSTKNKPLDEPQMEPVQIKEPAVSAYKIPTEQPLMNNAAVPEDQFASPMVAPPTNRPEGIAAPPLKFSQDAPAVELPAEDTSEDVVQPENLVAPESSLSTHHDSPLKSTDENKANRSVDQLPSTADAQQRLSNLKPLVEKRPINTDTVTHLKITDELPSPILRPDEKEGAVNIVSTARPPSTIAVASEADSLPIPPADEWRTESVATEVTSTSPATASIPVEAPSEIKLDQTIQSESVDVPSPSASESDPGAIIDAENIVSNARPPSTIAVTSETDSLPVPSANEGRTESVATEVTSTPPLTASIPVEAPSEIKLDQATKADFVDVPSQSASESDPGAIIDFVIRKRSRQLGNQ